MPRRKWKKWHLCLWCGAKTNSLEDIKRHLRERHGDYGFHKRRYRVIKQRIKE